MSGFEFTDKVSQAIGECRQLAHDYANASSEYNLFTSACKLGLTCYNSLSCAHGPCTLD